MRTLTSIDDQGVMTEQDVTDEEFYLPCPPTIYLADIMCAVSSIARTLAAISIGRQSSK